VQRLRTIGTTDTQMIVTVKLQKPWELIFWKLAHLQDGMHADRDGSEYFVTYLCIKKKLITLLSVYKK